MKDNKKIKNEKKEKKKKKGGKFNVHALLIIAEMSKKHKIKNRKILGNVFVISDMCIYWLSYSRLITFFCDHMHYVSFIFHSNP